MVMSTVRVCNSPVEPHTCSRSSARVTDRARQPRRHLGNGPGCTLFPTAGGRQRADQRGSRVIRGNLLAIPLVDAFIYVEPVYLEARQEASESPQCECAHHHSNFGTLNLSRC